MRTRGPRARLAQRQGKRPQHAPGPLKTVHLGPLRVKHLGQVRVEGIATEVAIFGDRAVLPRLVVQLPDALEGGHHVGPERLSVADGFGLEEPASQHFGHVLLHDGLDAFLSFAADWSAWGDWPAAYHATSLALHLVNTLLVLMLARRVIGPGASLLAQREREALEKTIAKQRVSAPKKAEPAPAKAPAAASSAEDFERELRQAFPASFALYSILGTEDKAQVRAVYDKSAPVGAARFHPVVSKIISLSIKKR